MTERPLQPEPWDAPNNVRPIRDPNGWHHKPVEAAAFLKWQEQRRIEREQERKSWPGR